MTYERERAMLKHHIPQKAMFVKPSPLAPAAACAAHHNTQYSTQSEFTYDALRSMYAVDMTHTVWTHAHSVQHTTMDMDKDKDNMHVHAST